MQNNNKQKNSGSKEKTKRLPDNIPGAVRIACPNCGRVFNYHLHYGMATNICARCNHVFLTKFEHSVVDLSISKEDLEKNNGKLGA